MLHRWCQIVRGLTRITLSLVALWSFASLNPSAAQTPTQPITEDYSGAITLSRSFQQQGDYSRAEAVLRAATDCFQDGSTKARATCLPVQAELAAVEYHEGHYRDSSSIVTSIIANTDPNSAVFIQLYPTFLNILAADYQKDNRSPSEVSVLYEKALSLIKGSTEDQSELQSMVLTNLGALNLISNPSIAKANYQRALDIRRTLTKKTVDPGIALDLKGLGVLSELSGDNASGESLYREALSYVTAPHPDNFPLQAAIEADLAEVLLREGRYVEAQTQIELALAWMEAHLSSDNSDLLNTLNTSAVILSREAKLKEAIGIHKRILAAREQKREGKEIGADVSQSEVNIGELLEMDGQFSAAQTYLNRAITSVSSDPSASKSDIGYRYIIIGRFYRDTHNYVKSVEAFHTALGFERTPQALDELAKTFESMGDQKQAGAFYKEAIEMLSADKLHADYGTALAHLGYLYARQRNWDGAVDYLRKATKVELVRTRVIEKAGSGSISWDTRLESDDGISRFKSLARALYHLSLAHPGQADVNDEMFLVAQLAQSSVSGLAVRQMAARAAAGDSELAAAVRDIQDLAAKREDLQGQLVRRRALVDDKVSSTSSHDLWADISAVDRELAARNRVVASKVHLVPSPQPEPVSMIEVQHALRNEEALVYVLDIESSDDLPGETFTWVVTKQSYSLTRSDYDTASLTDAVFALRCGLDPQLWDGISNPWKCAQVLGLQRRPSVHEPLPFSLELAWRMYSRLIGGAETLTKGRDLIFVTSGPLIGLPLQVLVTQKPDENIPKTLAGYADVSWLVRDHGVAVIPEMDDLLQLRSLPPSGASKPYTAYANPHLAGDGSCVASPELRTCGSGNIVSAATAKEPRWADAVARSATVQDLVQESRNAADVVARVRSLCPLPETAMEVKCVASDLHADDEDLHVGDAATVQDLERRSESGELASYKVVHFATHGLMAGDTASLTQMRAEPALVLTPGRTQGHVDSGLLDTSTISQLRLDADWIILSACNTAAGSGDNTPALSGLARAFFYAGARSMLVSNWPVYSDAAVRLVSDVFAFRKAGQSKSAALRAAEIELLNSLDQDDNSHPSVWAPFSLVGVD